MIDIGVEKDVKIDKKNGIMEKCDKGGKRMVRVVEMVEDGVMRNGR